MSPKPKYSSSEQKKTADALRRAFEAGRIGPRLEHLIDSVNGPAWKERRAYRATSFDDVFQMLELFVGQFGHANVPYAHVAPDGFALGKWVSTTRQVISGTKKMKLSAEQRKRLESLPGWVWSTKTSFDDAFRMLEAFASEFGHTRVPQRYRTSDGVALGVWVARVRAIANGTRRGALGATEKKALEALPAWTWSAKLSFDEVLLKLEDFVAEFGHANVSRRYQAPDGYSLGTWVANIRALANGVRDGVVPESQRAALERLPGWVWSAPRLKTD